jgi:cytochrome c biogenesis protein CcmG, thiol:disulfide interchange protein DsbE
VTEARIRRTARYLIVALSVGVLMVQYVRAIGPAAGDQRPSPCQELEPTPFSAALGKLPAAAPGFALADLAGASVPLESLRGQVVLLNFWQPSCKPCVAEMPAMEELQARLGPDGLTVLAVAEAGGDAVRAFFPRGTGMTVLLDERGGGRGVGSAAHRYGTDRFPESYLIDRRGVVRYYFVNQRDWAAPAALDCVRSILEEK